MWLRPCADGVIPSCEMMCVSRVGDPILTTDQVLMLAEGSHTYLHGSRIRERDGKQWIEVCHTTPEPLTQRRAILKCTCVCEQAHLSGSESRWRLHMYCPVQVVHTHVLKVGYPSHGCVG